MDRKREKKIDWLTRFDVFLITFNIPYPPIARFSLFHYFNFKTRKGSVNEESLILFLI